MSVVEWCGHDSRGNPTIKTHADGREELLDAEAFNTLLEARVLIEQWRVHYNRVRPHSSLGYRPPAPEAVVPGMPILPLGKPDPTGSHQPSLTMPH